MCADSLSINRTLFVDLIQSLILGLVEGATEFLPISSTGHLIIVSQLLGLKQTDSHIAFEIIIQLGAVLAVITNYRDKFKPQYFDLWVKVAIAFVPAAAVGLLVHSHLKTLFSIHIVAVTLFTGGIIFLAVEYYLKNREPTVNRVEDISYKQALVIGCAQIAALVPGTSRSGSTIIGALLMGINRKVSAEFSFLLALPIMLAATGLNVVKHYDAFVGTQMLPLVVGFVMAFISAYIAIRLLVKFLGSYTFNIFGIYRILLGLLLFYLIYTGFIPPDTST
ncbi:undecaprenyl-diphosphate phosphatase [Thiofilum flexile]|uniref:undecaprenyl-diphosphate phosphatase n=1 Tax=Thiofilum flexile TaxID=125627 RepID=UPI001FDF8797|nr:undecaprenyl-diphosphate phosphatase [Thiofilum flexile]